MKAIFDQYGWDVIGYEPLNQGLINTTYSVNTTTGEFILQTVNHAIFKNPAAIDFNINAIGFFLKNHFPTYLFTHLYPTNLGHTLIEWEGRFYRAFKKINGYALDVLDNPLQGKEAAKQFGLFTHNLREFKVNDLKLTLPDFHNLSLRYQQFEAAVINGNQKRIQQSKGEIEFLKAHKSYVNKYENFIISKEVRQRVTHHDTKISNVLFKKVNSIEKAICVIDLDTVMPGYYISDIGDMCRTYLSPVSEEETKLDLITINKFNYDAIQDGYLSVMKDELSNYELDHFHFSGQFMIYMQALRFLTDHFNNDVYYGAKKEGQNYVRALNQIRLLERFNEIL
jgi:Ser/Thr protein kinase RdoA (MazF antagonist)